MALLIIWIGCDNNTDPRWQLRHDRIIAVRATPPAVAPGDVTTIDAFVTDGEGGTKVVAPIAVAVEAGGTVDGNRITVAADRASELVVEVIVPVGDQQLAATKVVPLGRADNPTIGAVTLDGAPATASMQIPATTDVTLAVEAPETIAARWLTSCGSLQSDDNEHVATLEVEDGDPRSGQLALVVRDGQGGVAWTTWQIAVEGP